MKEMTEEAIIILNNNREEIYSFGKLLDESWKLKRSLSSRVTTNAIDEMYNTALKAGAIGGKLCGAGGGGFMLLFVPPRKQRMVKKALKELLYVPLNFETLGSQITLYANQEPY
jgi:D-glycero-alpha-D-manno-heptose-7-phosphate kinase